MCLSRKDLMDLCGHADGIRLYNSIHSRVLRTLYIRFMQEDKGQLTLWSYYSICATLKVVTGGGGKMDAQGRTYQQYCTPVNAHHGNIAQQSVRVSL